MADKEERMKIIKRNFILLILIVLVISAFFVLSKVKEEAVIAKTTNYGNTNVTETMGYYKNLLGIKLEIYRITGKVIDIRYNIITEKYLIIFEGNDTLGDLELSVCCIEGYDLEKGRFYTIEVIKSGLGCKKIMKLEEI